METFDRIRDFGHVGLPSYASLKGKPRNTVQSVVYQLVDQGALQRTPGDRPVLRLTKQSQALLTGEGNVKLIRPTATKTTATETSGWEDVDRGLFEHLREIRRALAEERRLPAFIILSDANLRDIARLRPASVGALARVKGLGERKLADIGATVVDAVVSYCKQNNLSVSDVLGSTAPAKENPAKNLAFQLFSRGRSLTDVAGAIGRAPGTTSEYLAEFIAERHPINVRAWVGDDVYRKVLTAARDTGADRLKPIFEHLNGEVSYEEIRVVLAHAASAEPAKEAPAPV